MMARMTTGEAGAAPAHAEHIFELRWTELVIEKTKDEDGDTMKKKLGDGSFGTVFAGRLRGASVAIKANKLPTTKSKADFMAECEVLSRLRHPHLCGFFGAAIQGTQGRMATERLACTLLAAVHHPKEVGRLPLTHDERMYIMAEVRQSPGWVRAKGKVQRV